MGSRAILTWLVGSTVAAGFSVSIIAIVNSNGIGAQVVDNQVWKSDCVFDNGDGGLSKLYGRFVVSLDNVVGDETVRPSIAAAYNSAGERVDYIKVLDDSKVIPLEKGAKYVPINIGFSRPEMYKPENGDSYTFDLNVTIGANYTSRTKLIQGLTLTCGKVTTRDNFTYTSGNATITGWNTASDYQDCTIFLLPEGVKTINANAFASKIPSGMKSLCLDPTYGMGKPTLETIGNSAFSYAPFTCGCTIPSSVKTIGSSAFTHTQFSGLNFGSNPEDKCALTTIDVSAFEFCQSFQGDIKFPEGVITIKKSAFRYARLTGDVYLPTTINTVGDLAFATVNNATTPFKFIIPEGTAVQFGGEVFYDAKLSEFIYPDASKGYTLPGGIFRGCRWLTKVSLPSTDLNGAWNQFLNCSVLSLLDLSRVETPSQGFFVKSNPNIFKGACSQVDKITVLIKDTPEIVEKEETLRNNLIASGIPKDKLVIERVKN